MRAFILLPISMAALLALGRFALADPAPSAPALTQATAPHDAGKIVCRHLAPPTGTRLGTRRVCRTQKEWDDIQQQQQDETSKLQIRGLTTGVIAQ